MNCCKYLEKINENQQIIYETITKNDENIEKQLKQIKRLLFCIIRAWEQNVCYDKGAIVLDNGKLLKCTKKHLSNDVHVLNKEYWEIIEEFNVDKKGSENNAQSKGIQKRNNRKE